jgi:hypothetical protein
MRRQAALREFTRGILNSFLLLGQQHRVYSIA